MGPNMCKSSGSATVAYSFRVRLYTVNAFESEDSVPLLNLGDLNGALFV